ncbi:MAG TPA: prepilin-type N-terminal cleavage/methylation domain-containing protein [Pirellulaceae bacterium]|nr:prepilin-type N-terminal cleavage/methylation domain-containing protein [Pirellulaceae bacterium]HMO92695.1 prepilin-type N-terminal cleavage/methylation domain-containing protein [Pirellulaceae bacterium]HMP70384.1 prepilin-type N-terminal cleavage/methylation domain-containing protein [Pirellulaceae bacterium]
MSNRKLHDRHRNVPAIGVVLQKLGSLGTARRIDRNGLSLLEVILALAILGLTLGFIGQLLRMGAQSAESSKQISLAQIMCDAKMAELSAGVISLASKAETEFNDEPGWFYSIDVQSAAQVGLLRVKVSVTTAEARINGIVLFSLTRLMPDPDYDPYTAEGQ